LTLQFDTSNGGHCNYSPSILIDLAVDLRHDCKEKVKVREHGREGNNPIN